MTPKKTFSIPVSNGILTAEHYKRMKDAVWYFLWCVDRTTKEVADESGNVYGVVLGGMPCRDEDLAGTFGVHVNTIRKWRKRLTKEGYIETTRTPIGYSIKVVKSKKWVGKGAKNVVPLKKSDPHKTVGHSAASDPQKTVTPFESDPHNRGLDPHNRGLDPHERVNPIRHNSDFTKTKQEESTFVLPLDSENPGQDPEELVTFAIKIALSTNAAAAGFYKKCKQELKDTFVKVRPVRDSVERVVRQQVGQMDDFGLKQAGSQLAGVMEAALLSDIETQAAAERLKQAEADAIAASSTKHAQEMEEFERRQQEKLVVVDPFGD
jgi:hypothetical protein